ncbi:MAG: bacterial Ig-like domain-containing protein [Bacteroidaceae bacterium]|nr:bacterial Ig-like domain-containing protein [Bacteroidaceae bacterium]
MLTITALSGQTINSITVTYTSTSYANGKVTVAGAEVTGSGSDTEKSYTIGGASSFAITNGNSSNTQVRFSRIVIDYTPNASTPPLASIALSGDYPTEFIQGDAFSHEGAVVTATYEDNSTKDVTSSATFSSPDMTTLGNQTVTVSYTEGEVTKTTDYTITVSAPPALASIALSGDYPTTFYQNDAFSYAGAVVTATYEDNSTKDVTSSATFSTPDMTTTGTKEVTVSYTEGEVTKTTSYNITVNEYVQPTAFDINLNNTLFRTNYTGTVSSINDANPVTGTLNQVTVTYAGSGNHYINNSQIRFYPNNKLTFEAPAGYNITEIVFTDGGTWTATIGATPGTYDTNTKTWTGNASSVLFEGSGSSGHCRMSKAAITLAIASNKQPAELAFATTEYNVKTTQVNSFTAPTATTAAGYDGTVTYASSDETLALVDESTGEVVLESQEGTVTITATATETENYLGGTASYTINIMPVRNIAQFVALDNNAESFLDLTEALVVYKNGSRMYVRDNSGAIQFYNTDLEWNTGDVLLGDLKATKSAYRNNPQIQNYSDNGVTVFESGQTVTPKAIDLAAAGSNLNDLVTFTFSNIVANEGKYYATDGTNQVQLYNQFNIEGLDFTILEDGTNYRVTGIPTMYNSTIEILPTQAIEDLTPVVPKVAKIGDVEYASLEEAFAAAQDGETITLLSDCAGNGIKVTPAGKFATGLTVDFAGFTYTIDGETVGSTGTETNGFQLLKDNKVTFQNGTITSTKAKILVQNYSDLTLNNMTLTLNNPDYTGAYTLSNNNGNTVINGSTINANPAGGFAFDVCRFSSYPSVSVTVTGNSQINGDVEVSAGKSDPKNGFKLLLESGTLTGDIVLDQTAKNAMESYPDKAEVTKNNTFNQTAPEGYEWRDNGDGTSTLVKSILVLTLNETEDNSAVLEANNGKVADVTIGRSFVNTSYQTLSLPFDLTQAQVEAVFGTSTRVQSFTGAATDAEKNIVLNFTGATGIEAGKPYLILPFNNVENPTFTGVTVSNVAAQTVTGEQADFIANINATEYAANEQQMYLGADNKLYFNNTTATMKGFRAYFMLKGTTPGKTVGFSFDGTPTGITTITGNDNGNVNVNGWYTLDGQKLNAAPTQKGVYINNGRKVVVK